MFDINKLTPEARLFFDGMPPLMQENLVHAGAPYTTREELENYMRHQESGDNS